MRDAQVIAKLSQFSVNGIIAFTIRSLKPPVVFALRQGVCLKIRQSSLPQKMLQCELEIAEHFRTNGKLP